MWRSCGTFMMIRRALGNRGFLFCFVLFWNWKIFCLEKLSRRLKSKMHTAYQRSPLLQGEQSAENPTQVYSIGLAPRIELLVLSVTHMALVSGTTSGSHHPPAPRRNAKWYLSMPSHTLPAVPLPKVKAPHFVCTFTAISDSYYLHQ